MLATAIETGKAVAASGLADPSADIESFGKAFADLVAGTKAFAAAREASVQNAAAAVAAIRSVSDQHAASAAGEPHILLCSLIGRNHRRHVAAGPCGEHRHVEARIAADRPR